MKMHPKQAAAYELAKTFNGLREIRGPEDEQKIVQMFADVGHAWVKDDETAWCAAFVGAMLERSGLPSTRKLNARSYLDWGEEVDPADAQPGDLLVFWRERPDSWKGHVAFATGRINSKVVEAYGGNQKNRVGADRYPRRRLISVRRMPAPEAPKKPETAAPASAIVAFINWLGSLFNVRRG